MCSIDFVKLVHLFFTIKFLQALFAFYYILCYFYNSSSFITKTHEVCSLHTQLSFSRHYSPFTTSYIISIIHLLSLRKHMRSAYYRLDCVSVMKSLKGLYVFFKSKLTLCMSAECKWWPTERIGSITCIFVFSNSYSIATNFSHNFYSNGIWLISWFWYYVLCSSGFRDS